MSFRLRQIESIALLAVLACAIALPVRADLTGDTIRTWELYPDLGTIYGGPVDVVAPGTLAAFPAFAPIVDITFNATSITITMTRDATAFTSPFNGFRFFDVSEPLPFNSVSLDSATDVPGIDASSVSFDARDIYVNFSGITYSTGQEVSLDLQVVPEPSYRVLLPIAALLICIVGRRKRLTAGVPWINDTEQLSR